MSAAAGDDAFVYDEAISRPTGDAEEIDCRFDGIDGVVLRAEFVRKR